MNPSRWRSSPVTIGSENAATDAGSSCGYSAEETITAPEPAWMPPANGCRYGSSTVAVRSTAPVDVSVFARTRPRPGKCLSVVTTPVDCTAVTTVPTSSATASGAEPYCRSNAPIGGFWSAVPAGTVSATGARSIVIPARARRCAQSTVRVRSVA